MKNLNKVRLTVQIMGVAFFALAFQGCAHTAADQQIDQKVSQEATVKNQNDLNAETKNEVAAATNLTAAQKEKLSSLKIELQT